MTSPLLSRNRPDAEPRPALSHCAVASLSVSDERPACSSLLPRSKVLIASPYVFGVGGVAVAIRCISNELTNRGCAVMHLTRGPGIFIRPLPQETAHPTYTFHFRHLAPTLKSHIAFWLVMPLSCSNIACFLMRHKIDHVLIQYPVAGHLPLAAACRLLGIRLCVTFQGSDAHRLQELPRSESLHLKSLLRLASSITAVSQSLANKVHAFCPALREQPLTIIPNGTPSVPATAGPTEAPARKLRITAVGRLIPRKGFDVLIRAIGLLGRQARAVDCRIIGEGPDLDALQNLIVELGLEKTVQLVGSMDHGAVLKELQATDIFVLSSRAEGAALVLAEAMASRCAIISTAVDGALEAITSGENGLLVDVDNADALAAALQQLLTEPELRLRLAACGFVSSRELVWDRITERYLEVMQGTCGR